MRLHCAGSLQIVIALDHSNCGLPSATCLQAWMSFVVFVLPRKELATRLGVAVTLFLALAAVQVRCMPIA